MYTMHAMIFNTAGNTYHPVLFRDAPLPGNPENLRRLRSVGHHTAGFPTREAAAEWVKSKQPDIPFDEEAMFIWDGTDIPALTCFLQDGKVVAL